VPPGTPEDGRRPVAVAEPPVAPLAALLAAGEAALERGEGARAVAALTDALALAPHEVGIALALANGHRLAGDLAAERDTLHSAWRTGRWGTAPEQAHALGAALLRVGHAHEAATCFEQVLASHPEAPAALAALASARRQEGRPVEAWPLVARAVRQAPTNGAVLLTAAQVRHDLGDLAGALTWLDKAERARPGHAGTRLQRAYTVLLGGACHEGWTLFEHRALPQGPAGARPWQGEPLAGSSVLVVAEQGVGDQLQFLRYVPSLRERGASRVLVECPNSLCTLLQANGFETVGRGTDVSVTWSVPLMSLPLRLGTDRDVAGHTVPYLRAPALTSDRTHAARTERPAGHGARLRLGLVWAGNPDFPGRALRDLDAAALQAVLTIADVDWVPLQLGLAADAVPASMFRLPPATDWAMTSARLAELDGLVTTDTGIAHLAGAMGMPTWVLLQYVPDWRWGLSGERTAWYPSARLVRQPAPRDWLGAISRLAALLADASPRAWTAPRAAG
jgi:Flp pilus assembly protein TadD